MKTRDHMEKTIEKNCRDVIETKLKIKERNFTSKETRIELINMKEEEGIYLKELNIYIIKLLNYLYLQPKLTANILSWANMKDMKENLSSFIGNYFYENFLSPNYITCYNINFSLSSIKLLASGQFFIFSFQIFFSNSFCPNQEYKVTTVDKNNNHTFFTL